MYQARHIRKEFPAANIIEYLELPIFVCGDDFRILFANDRAKRALKEAKVFSDSQGYLEAEPRVKAVLRTAMKSASPASNQKLAITDNDSVRHRYILQLLASERTGTRDGTFMVIGSGRSPSVETLVKRYALTRVEASLVMRLLAGRDISEVAADLKISTHTARKYLQAIFAKTEVNRQVDLIRKVLDDQSWNYG